MITHVLAAASRMGSNNHVIIRHWKTDTQLHSQSAVHYFVSALCFRVKVNQVTFQVKLVSTKQVLPAKEKAESMAPPKIDFLYKNLVTAFCSLIAVQ